MSNLILRPPKWIFFRLKMKGEFKTLFEVIAYLGVAPHNVIDIGSNIGVWTRTWIQQYPRSRVLMIDGNPANAPIYDNMRNKRIRYYIGILSQTKDRALWFKSDAASTGASLLQELSPMYKDVIPSYRNTTTLDVLCFELHCGKVDVLKIDTQGAELSVLRGSTRVLQNVKVILMEMPFLGQFNRGAPRFAEYVSFMDSIGFLPFDMTEVHRRTKDSILLQVDFVYVRKNLPILQTIQENIQMSMV